MEQWDKSLIGVGLMGEEKLKAANIENSLKDFGVMLHRQSSFWGKFGSKKGFLICFSKMEVAYLLLRGLNHKREN